MSCTSRLRPASSLAATAAWPGMGWAASSLRTRPSVPVCSTRRPLPGWPWRPARPRPCSSTRRLAGKKVMTTCSPPLRRASGDGRMSVPRPAVLVATVTAPASPARRSTSSSSSSCRAVSSCTRSTPRASSARSTLRAREMEMHSTSTGRPASTLARTSAARHSMKAVSSSASTTSAASAASTRGRCVGTLKHRTPYTSRTSRRSTSSPSVPVTPSTQAYSRKKVGCDMEASSAPDIPGSSPSLTSTSSCRPSLQRQLRMGWPVFS
mmetsp:Transcript_1237/g.4217  ORF Transcript_1237/g.4217 Transcript_1237/m.4217 type:complete len:266 (+) Transcript_1237:484-1281(+)